MLLDNLAQLFTRDLHKLETEIAAYKKEANLWILEKEVSNSAGNLCLHLIGNLNAFVGAVLGNTGYVRDRPTEFSTKDVPVAELLQKIDNTLAIVLKTLQGLSPEDLEKEYPLNIFGEPMTIGFFLMHLSTHLAYHLGQINYHRRLLDN